MVQLILEKTHIIKIIDKIHILLMQMILDKTHIILIRLKELKSNKQNLCPSNFLSNSFLSVSNNLTTLSAPAPANNFPSFLSFEVNTSKENLENVLSFFSSENGLFKKQLFPAEMTKTSELNGEDLEKYICKSFILLSYFCVTNNFKLAKF